MLGKDGDASDTDDSVTLGGADVTPLPKLSLSGRADPLDAAAEYGSPHDDSPRDSRVPDSASAKFEEEEEDEGKKFQWAGGQSNITVAVRVRPLVKGATKSVVKVLDSRVVVVLDPSKVRQGLGKSTPRSYAAR